MDTEIAIRAMRPGDYDALIALWEAAGLPCKPKGRDSREAITHQLELSTAIYLVAELDGTMVGSVLGTHDGRKGFINRLAVDPAYRGRGIARRLVAEVERRLENLGIEIVEALIEDWNEVSMKVFERLGYVKHPDIFYYSKRKHPDV
jgi:ribosomal protein S18 acetylase RimI-like enzyme